MPSRAREKGKLELKLLVNIEGGGLLSRMIGVLKGFEPFFPWPSSYYQSRTINGRKTE